MDSMSLILFAQGNKGEPPVPPELGGILALGLPVLIGLGCVILLSMAIGLAMMIWYLMTMHKLYSAISPSNRDMEPGMVFIALIPGVGYIWMWLIMLRACSSLQKEFDARGLSDEGGDFGKTKGLVHLLGVFCGPVGLIGFILYVLQMKKYLAELGGSSSGGGKKKKIADDDDE